MLLTGCTSYWCETKVRCRSGGADIEYKLDVAEVCATSGANAEDQYAQLAAEQIEADGRCDEPGAQLVETSCPQVGSFPCTP